MKSVVGFSVCCVDQETPRWYHQERNHPAAGVGVVRCLPLSQGNG